MNTTSLKSVVFVALFTLLVSATGLQAADKVTLTGTAMCAMCTLHESDTCQTVLEVKGTDGKVVRYYFTNDMDHAKFCHGKTEGVTVTGTVSEKDGKKYITPENITTK
jgi:hypothetical protein